MQCSNCDCGNQPVLLTVHVPTIVNRGREQEYTAWVEAFWCRECVEVADLEDVHASK